MMKNKKMLNKGFAVLLATVVAASAAPAAMAAPVQAGPAAVEIQKGAPGLLAVTFAAAAKKKGFVKTSGKWYYYKNGKKVTGLKKISGKYYYFDKKGVMKTGKQTIDGFTYYFKKVTKGAKKGQAPAIVSKSYKIGKTSYYFTSKGRGFLSVGNDKGNKAVADVMDQVSFKNVSGKDAKLKKVYGQILKRYGYEVQEKPDLSKKTWVYESAKVMADDKVGKCYNYAAITGLCARALGFQATIVVGECDVHIQLADGTERGYTEHAWVLIGDKVLDTVYADTRNKPNEFYLKTYDQIKSSMGFDYKVIKKY